MQSAAPARLSLGTFVIVVTSSFCFCSKGVMAKLMYREGLDAMTVLALRMALALPFFFVGYLWSVRGGVSQPLPRKMWVWLLGIGFLGYYLSSLANFAGLKYISVGLERVVLYTYPTLVLLGNWAFYRQRPSRAALWGAVLAYVGICVAFWGEAAGRGGAADHVALGVGLVFCSALTYAAFILLSSKKVAEVGALRFTSIVVSASGFMVLLHAALVVPWVTFTQLPSRAWWLGLLIAVVGTVIPSFLMGLGLRLAGPTRFAIIGSVGPILTLALSWYVLGEELNAAQLAGFALSLVGGLSVTLRRS
jgi:drug/metabolite transporter (DMT)-like permease